MRNSYIWCETILSEIMSGCLSRLSKLTLVFWIRKYIRKLIVIISYFSNCLRTYLLSINASSNLIYQADKSKFAKAGSRFERWKCKKRSDERVQIKTWFITTSSRFPIICDWWRSSISKVYEKHYDGGPFKSCCD